MLGKWGDDACLFSVYPARLLPQGDINLVAGIGDIAMV